MTRLTYNQKALRRVEKLYVRTLETQARLEKRARQAQRDAQILEEQIGVLSAAVAKEKKVS